MIMLHCAMRRAGALLLCAGALSFQATTASAGTPCIGDCDGSESVVVSELITGVNIALGSAAVSACASFDCQRNGTVPINCLTAAVTNALEGCPSSCPLAAAAYTLIQASGGTLTVASLPPIPFPSGGTLVLDIGAGDGECVHDAVVPFPGGFNVPTFCIPGTGFTVRLEQTGCGIGRIDSDGGADYTVTELGDTSDGSDTCNLSQVCTNGVDSAVRVDVTVGDGTPDTCSGGTANAIVAVPVHTTAWLEQSSGASCPANDGTFDPDHGDQLVVALSQILDLTTDTNTAIWMDLDGDGCRIAGAGPAAGFSSTGTCLDLDANTLTTADSGPVGSKAGPFFDMTFTNLAPSTFSGPEAPLGATCASPPIINFNGTVSRCIHASD